MNPTFLILAALLLAGCQPGTIATAQEEDDNVTSNTSTITDSTTSESDNSQPSGVETDGQNTNNPISEDSSTSVSSSVNPDDSVCVVAASDLSTAHAAFKQQCATATYRDCDQYPSGGWACASGVIGSMGPDGAVGTTPFFEPPPPTNIVIVGPVVDEPVITVPPVDVDPIVVTPTGIRVDVEDASATGWLFTQKSGHEGSGSLEWRGANQFGGPNGDNPGVGSLSYFVDIPSSGTYSFTIRAHITDGPGQSPQAPDKNNDAFIKVGDNPWRKVFHQTRGSWANTLDYTESVQAGQLTVQISGRSQYFVIDTLIIEPTNVLTEPVKSDTLIVVHGDFAPDPDEFQAFAAAKAIADKLNLNPIVVIGTYGHDLQNRFIPEAVQYGKSLFPNAYDAYTNRAQAVSNLRSDIESALSQGRSVSIAEGGPSDFSYDVLSQVSSAYNLKNVTIVQHSTVFNEGQTSASNLAWLKANTNYVNIGNGNVGGNTGTADFQEERGSSQCGPFEQAALSSKYSQQWALAFSLEVDARYCDFSDAVELLHIVGDTSTRTMADFSRTYIK